MIRGWLLVVAAAILSCSCSSDPSMGGGVETTTGSVAGRVRLPDGSPLVGAQVTLRGDGRTPGLEVSTDSGGRFRIDSVPYGSWRLQARAVRLDTFLARTSFDLLPSHPAPDLDTLVVRPVVHVRMRILLPSGLPARGARLFLADSSCFSPFDPWNIDRARCRTRTVASDSLGRVEMDDLPASTWYLEAVAPGSLVARRVYRALHGGGIWQWGDIGVDTALGWWDARRSGVRVRFAFAQFGDGATSSWDEQQRVVGDDSGRIWLDKGLDLYHQPWVVYQSDSLLAEGFVPDTVPRRWRVDLGASEIRVIDLSTGGPMQSDSGNAVEILAVSRANHATVRVAPDPDGKVRVGPFRAGGPWDLRIDYRCHSRRKAGLVWDQVWGGVLQEPRLDPGTWTSVTCEEPKTAVSRSP